MPTTQYTEYLLECFNIPKLFNGMAKYDFQTRADKQAGLVREFNRHILPKLKTK